MVLSQCRSAHNETSISVKVPIILLALNAAVASYSAITEKIMCQGCKLDYCLKCGGINFRLFEYLNQGDMEDFLWSGKSCKASFPSLDNITKYLTESLAKKLH